MTLIVGWVAYDQNSVSSAYLMSDSRYTSGDARFGRFDLGSKLFVFDNSPDIFGFCGDVTAMLSLMSNLKVEDKRDLLFPPNSDSYDRSKIITGKMETSLCPSFIDSSLFHVSFDLKSHPHFFKYCCFSNPRKITFEEVPLRNDKKSTSSIVFSDGSGRTKFNQINAIYQRGISGDTSRAFFQAFISTMSESKNETFGGHPQLVCLRRGMMKGIEIGIIYQKSLYFMGEELDPISADPRLLKIDWFNERFERCNPFTKEREKNAQIQPDPLAK